jgi:hypothetical protein
MQCKLCRRETKKSGGLCRYHSAARDELKEGYGTWKEAYPGLTWRDYLNRVKALEWTGQWVKEVVTLEEASTIDKSLV